MKKIVITGASSGIGKASKTKLIDAGYELIGLSRRENNIDFADIKNLEAKLKPIAKANTDINTLILNCKYLKKF